MYSSVLYSSNGRRCRWRGPKSLGVRCGVSCLARQLGPVSLRPTADGWFLARSDYGNVNSPTLKAYFPETSTLLRVGRCLLVGEALKASLHCMKIIREEERRAESGIGIQYFGSYTTYATAYDPFHLFILLGWERESEQRQSKARARRTGKGHHRTEQYSSSYP